MLLNQVKCCLRQGPPYQRFDNTMYLTAIPPYSTNRVAQECDSTFHAARESRSLTSRTGGSVPLRRSRHKVTGLQGIRAINGLLGCQGASIRQNPLYFQGPCPVIRQKSSFGFLSLNCPITRLYRGTVATPAVYPSLKGPVSLAL